MKKALFLLFSVALITGCGSTSHYTAESDTLDIGYGVQDKDKATTVMVTSDNRIIIRGIGTNSDATDPLILVDGVEMSDLSGINPADVKSVDVIKDGSSAIYGMQGANGVIIIKTVGSGDN